MGKWIAGAIKHPGSFSAKAKHAGMSTAAYAKKEQHAPGKLGREARLALTLERLPHHHASGHRVVHSLLRKRSA